MIKIYFEDSLQLLNSNANPSNYKFNLASYVG